MKLRCEVCKNELRGKRVWDNYELGTCHNEYHCQNKICSEFEKPLGTRDDVELGKVQSKEDEIADLETRVEELEEKTADLGVAPR